MSLCILCPGQGSQSPGMFGPLLADAATGAVCRALADALDPELLALAGDPSRCFANRFAQPLICLYQMSVWSSLRDAGVAPALVAGYSVGELAAWGVAAALPAPALLRAAVARAIAMDASAPPTAGMLAVRGLRLAAIEAVARASGTVVAIRNGDQHAVLAGPATALADAQQALAQSSAAHLVRLPISVPAHSPWLAAAVPQFAAALATLDWQEPACPVLAGIDGQPRYRRIDAIGVLSRQLAEPLEWARVLDVAVEMGATRFFEIGPGNALCRMLRERHPEREARALDDFATLAGALRWLQAGAER